MKKAINLQGIEVDIADDVTVNTIDGINYLLTSAQQTELDAKTTIWQAGAIARNARAEILRLEAQITTRRIREAIVGVDDGWLVNQDALIATERAKLI